MQLSRRGWGSSHDLYFKLRINSAYHNAEEEHQGHSCGPDINPLPDGEAKRQISIDELMMYRMYRLVRDELANEN